MTAPASRSDRDLAVVAGALTKAGPVPLHAQVAQGVRGLIASGRWQPGLQLPAEPDLAEMLGVSRGTVRRAIQTLIGEGLVTQTHGKGTFVNDAFRDFLPVQSLVTISEAMDLSGVAFETDVLESAIVEAPDRVALNLDLENGQPCLRLVRVRRVAGKPVAFLVNFVRSDRCPGIERADFEVRRLFDVIENEYELTIDGGQRTYAAQAAGSEVAETLGIEVGSPVLNLTQVTYLSDNSPIECSEVWMRGDWMSLTADVRREHRSPRSVRA